MRLPFYFFNTPPSIDIATVLYCPFTKPIFNGLLDAVFVFFDKSNAELYPFPLLSNPTPLFESYVLALPDDAAASSGKANTYDSKSGVGFDSKGNGYSSAFDLSKKTNTASSNPLNMGFVNGQYNTVAMSILGGVLKK